MRGIALTTSYESCSKNIKILCMLVKLLAIDETFGIN